MHFLNNNKKYKMKSTKKSNDYNKRQVSFYKKSEKKYKKIKPDVRA